MGWNTRHELVRFFLQTDNLKFDARRHVFPIRLLKHDLFRIAQRLDLVAQLFGFDRHKTMLGWGLCGRSALGIALGGWSCRPAVRTLLFGFCLAETWRSLGRVVGRSVWGVLHG